jgi:hypothetical protein
MIAAMAPADFTPDSQEQNAQAYQRALTDLRVADARRVRHMTGLTSPFGSNSKY